MSFLLQVLLLNMAYKIQPETIYGFVIKGLIFIFCPVLS